MAFIETEDAIYNMLVQWANGLTGVLFIRAFESEVRPGEVRDPTTTPPGQYGTINIVDNTNIGQDEVRHQRKTPDPGIPNPALEEMITATRTYMASINVYRNEENAVGDIIKGPTDICEQLKRSIRSQFVHQQYFLPLGVGPVNVSNTRRLPIDVKNRSEPRAEFDFFFNITQKDTYELDNIEQVAIGQSYIGAGTGEDIKQLPDIEIDGGS